MDDVDIGTVWQDRETGEITEVEVVVTRTDGAVERYTCLTT